MFGSVPIYDVPMSCRRLSYSSWYKMEISRTDENHGKPCRVCKNNLSKTGQTELGNLTANSDQSAPSTLFVQSCLSKNLGSLKVTFGIFTFKLSTFCFVCLCWGFTP